MHKHEKELFDRLLDEAIGDSTDTDEELVERVDKLEQQIQELASIVARIEPERRDSDSEEEVTTSQKQRVNKELEGESLPGDLDSRYPLDGTPESFNHQRKKYELRNFFVNRESNEPVNVYEIVEYIWGFRPDHSRKPNYYQVSQTLSESMPEIQKTDDLPAKWYLAPNVDKDSLKVEVTNQ